MVLASYSSPVRSRAISPGAQYFDDTFKSTGCMDLAHRVSMKSITTQNPDAINYEHLGRHNPATVKTVVTFRAWDFFCMS